MLSPLLDEWLLSDSEKTKNMFKEMNNQKIFSECATSKISVVALLEVYEFLGEQAKAKQERQANPRT